MSFYPHIRLCLLLAASLFLASQPASAAKRVALVIGNSNYQNAPALPNPANDAAAIAATLKGAGFDIVDSRLNLGANDIRRALRDFADQARDADVALVYYAGHGLEIDGTNYLIPVDAKLERDTDIYDEALSLDRVLLAIEPARQLRVVIVDACRNNPIVDSMKRTMASRSINRGLARIEPTTANTLVAFAAKAGLTALDGVSKNSPYAAALVKYIAKPGLDLRRAFGFVRDDVMQATGNRQEPYVYGSLGGEDFSLVPAPKTEEPKAAANPDSEMRRDYELASQLHNKAAFEAFLAKYPDGYYANLAKLQLDQVGAEEARVGSAATVAPPVQVAEPVQVAPPAQVAEPAQIAPPVQVAAPVQDDNATTKVAALNPAPPKTDPTKQAELTKKLTESVQTELNRVGCFTGTANGEWNAASARSLVLFNQHAGTNLDVWHASLDALDAIKLRSSRVCPLVCEDGYRSVGDQCTKITTTTTTCEAGSSDKECEKRDEKKTVAKRHTNSRRARADHSNRQDQTADHSDQWQDPTPNAPRQQETVASQGGMGGITVPAELLANMTPAQRKAAARAARNLERMYGNPTYYNNYNQ